MFLAVAMDSFAKVGGSVLKTYMLTPTDTVNIYLRRYQSSDKGYNCRNGSYHDGQILVGKEKAVFENKGLHTVRVDPYLDEYKERYPYSHEKWPTECDECDYKFTDDDERQIFTVLMWERSDTGELVSINDSSKIPGALYYAWWLKNNPSYPDTGPLYAICPNGYPWNIDGRASNCTMPEDNKHRCWVRHGEPPEITVDKNGYTCAAGAGSIQAGDYHGFLQNGHFT